MAEERLPTLEEVLARDPRLRRACDAFVRAQFDPPIWSSLSAQMEDVRHRYGEKEAIDAGWRALNAARQWLAMYDAVNPLVGPSKTGGDEDLVQEVRRHEGQ